MIKKLSFIGALLITCTSYGAATPKGVYVRTHQIGIVCGEDCADEESEEGSEPSEGWKTVDAQDMLEIPSVDAKTLTFSLQTWGTNAHSCSSAGSAKNIAPGKYVYSSDPKDSLEGQTCKFEFDTAKPNSVSIKISGDGCREFCGARHSFDDNEVFDNKLPMSEDLGKLDLKKFKSSADARALLNSEYFEKEWETLAPNQKQKLGEDLSAALKDAAAKYLKSDSPTTKARFEDYRGIAQTVQINQDHKQQAVLILESVLKRDHERAVKLFKKGDKKKAVSILEDWRYSLRRKLPWTPKVIAAPINDLGYFKEKTEDINGAIADYREVIKIDPSRAAAYLNLADLLWRNEADREEATVAYQEYVRRTPKAKLSKTVKERCPVCLRLEEFEPADKMPESFVGKWRATEAKCTAGKIKEGPAGFLKLLNQKGAETTSIEREIKSDGSFSDTSRSKNANTEVSQVYLGKLKLKGSKILETETQSKSDKSLLPSSDTIRGFVLEEKSGRKLLTLTSEDPTRSANWCEAGGFVVWTYEFISR